MLTTRHQLELRVGGQLPLVISFEAVILFVMSGAGLNPPNFNAEASESKLSGRIVPITNISTGSLLERLVNQSSLFSGDS